MSDRPVDIVWCSISELVAVVGIVIYAVVIVVFVVAVLL